MPLSFLLGPCIYYIGMWAIWVVQRPGTSKAPRCVVNVSRRRRKQQRNMEKKTGIAIAKRFGIRSNNNTHKKQHRRIHNTEADDKSDGDLGINTCVYIRICTFVYMYICSSLSLYIYIYLMYIDMRACVNMYMYACAAYAPILCRNPSDLNGSAPYRAHVLEGLADCLLDHLGWFIWKPPQFSAGFLTPPKS